MTDQDMFINRLRRRRERTGVAIGDIAQHARIRPDLIEAFERGDLSAWPTGLYARAWMRAYADSIGLDPAEVVDEFCRLFPQGDRRVQATMHQLAAIVDEPSRFVDDQAIQQSLYGRRASDRLAPPPPPSLRDRVSQAARIVVEVRRVNELPARLAASWRTLRPSRPTS
jgi:hypothetical protein